VRDFFKSEASLKQLQKREDHVKNTLEWANKEVGEEGDRSFGFLKKQVRLNNVEKEVIMYSLDEAEKKSKQRRTRK